MGLGTETVRLCTVRGGGGANGGGWAVVVPEECRGSDVLYKNIR